MLKQEKKDALQSKLDNEILLEDQDMSFVNLCNFRNDKDVPIVCFMKGKLMYPLNSLISYMEWMERFAKNINIKAKKAKIEQNIIEKLTIFSSELKKLANKFANFPSKPNALLLHEKYIAWEYIINNNDKVQKYYLKYLRHFNKVKKFSIVHNYIKNLLALYDVGKNLIVFRKLCRYVGLTISLRFNAYQSIMRQNKPPFFVDALHQTFPIINNGYCYGITVFFSHIILKKNIFTAKDLEEHKLTSKFDGYTALSMSNLQVVEALDILQFIGLHGKAATEKITILPRASLQLQTASTAAKYVATSISTILKKIDPGKITAALNLAIYGNDLIGHGMAIVVKNNYYFLIDANVGIFRTSSLKTLEISLARLLYKMKYTHRYSKFHVKNFPSIESVCTTPKVWQGPKHKLKLTSMRTQFVQHKKKSACAKPRQACSWLQNTAYQKFNYLRDKGCQMYAKGSVAKDTISAACKKMMHKK